MKWLVRLTSCGLQRLTGKSKAKAYALFESSLLDNIEVGTVKGLLQIHAYLSAMERSVTDSTEIKRQ